ncbi:hypothetical protein ACFCYV_04535, partial [Streptomyces sp. NPDC056255]
VYVAQAAAGPAPPPRLPAHRPHPRRGRAYGRPAPPRQDIAVHSSSHARPRRTRPDQLVGELLVKNPGFTALWERYEVTGRKSVQKTFVDPQVGTVTLTSQSLHVEGTPGGESGSAQPNPAARTMTPCSSLT